MSDHSKENKLKILNHALNKFNKSEFGIPTALIFSQYSNVLTSFVMILIVSRYSAEMLAVYAFTESLYISFRLISQGILSSFGIKLAKIARSTISTIYTREAINIILISLTLGIVIVLAMLYLSRINIFKSNLFFDGINSYIKGFVIGIVPNILMIAISQILAASEKASAIIKLKIAKIITLPLATITFLTAATTVSYYTIGAAIACGYLITFFLYLIQLKLSLRDKFNTSNSKKILNRILNKHNLYKILKTTKIGISTGLLTSIESLYVLFVLYLINCYSVQSQSVYYIISQISSLICAYPYGVSLAISYKTAQLGYAHPCKLLTYLKKMLTIIIPFLIIVTILLYTQEDKILALFEPSNKVLGNNNLLSDYDFTYNSLLITYIILEIPRLITIAILRGLNITFAPLIINLCGFWVVSLPIGLIIANITEKYISSFIIAEIVGLLFCTLIYLIILRKKYFSYTTL